VLLLISYLFVYTYKKVIIRIKKNSSGRHAKRNYINMTISIIIYKYVIRGKLNLVSFRDKLYEITKLSIYIKYLLDVFFI